MLDTFNSLLANIISIGMAILFFIGLGGDTANQISSSPPPAQSQSAPTQPAFDSPRSSPPKEESVAQKTQEVSAEIPPEHKTPAVENADYPALPPEPTAKEPEGEPALSMPTGEENFIPPALLNKQVRQATVNVFCLSKRGGLFNPLSGSGVIIDEKGIILTNAHIAQYYLLHDYEEPGFIECIIRTGSPAKAAYKAELLYIPPIWVRENASQIMSPAPRASGAHDYAFLLITESIPPKLPLPDAFSYLRLAWNFHPTLHTPVMIVSYPAGFLGGISLSRELWLVSTIGNVQEIYTFGGAPNHFVDIFSVHGTISAQEGSSGGGAVEFLGGHLAGLATTRTEGGSTGERTLRFLSMPYIAKDFREQTGILLADFLARDDLSRKADEFASSTAPILKQLLFEELGK